MLNNIHVSYDLNVPGKDYATLIKAIQSLGSAVKLQKSFWFISTSLTADHVATLLLRVMDKTDSLYVVDAKNNRAVYANIPPQAVVMLSKVWGVTSVQVGFPVLPGASRTLRQALIKR